MTPLPCIGCWGSPQPEIRPEGSAWSVCCRSCGRRTYTRDTQEEAVADWNRGLVAVSKAKGQSL